MRSRNTQGKTSATAHPPLDSSAAIGAVDAILAGGDLAHGRRSTRAGSWKDGQRVRSLKFPKPTEFHKTATHSALPEGAGLLAVAGWGKYPWLRAGFSTRQGGRSSAYGEDELNLGWTPEDPAQTVAANRKRFVSATLRARPAVMKADSVELVSIRQFHGGLIRALQEGHGALTTAEGKAVLRGDGLMTSLPGLLLAIQTADCVPVLVADTRRRAVAAFHAGWRGTLERIVERGMGAMQLQYGSRPQDLVAAIGPAIGVCCFAVGEEVRFEFESQFAYAPDLFSEVYDSDPVREKYPMLFLTARAPGHSNIGPQIHLDLIEANRRQLLDAGVRASQISTVGECTACTRVKGGSRKYFSHRAEHGFTGRMLSAIGIVD